MSRRGSGFGFVMLLVVLAIVMLLVAKNWKKVAPTAIEVSTPAGEVAVPDHGQAGAGEAVRTHSIPDLNDMRKQTGNHAQQVQDALQATR